MKNSKKILAMVMVLVFMFTVAMSSAVFAGTVNDKENGKNSAAEEKVKNNDKAVVEETLTEEETETEEEKANTEKTALLDEKKVAKKLLIELRKSAEATPEQIAEAYAKYLDYKAQLKQLVMDQYTEEELAELGQLEESLEAADPTLEVLPVEKVIAKGISMKLDLPPIYKVGKVHVPVRAFSRAYGADVQWNDELKQITITSADGVIVVIDTLTGAVTVDGQTVIIDRPLNVNGRVVLPVGFLAEQLGLKVEVDEEDGTIEIEEDTTTEE